MYSVLSKTLKCKWCLRCTSNISEKPFTVLYRWPTMRHFRLISRLKMYQVGGMILSIPPLSYWYTMGSISGSSLMYGCVAAAGATLVLCGLSYSFSRVLGELAYCNCSKRIRLSHLTFWGQRQDIEIEIKNIIPYSDSQFSSSSKLMQRLEIYHPCTVFYYSIKYGHIFEPETFKSIVGM